jgi:hypothetical protein
MSVLDHIYLDVSDCERSKAFFARALARWASGSSRIPLSKAKSDWHNGGGG